MGLTIHYSLQSPTRSFKKARKLVEQLRKRALDLPFQKVGEIVELSGSHCDSDECDSDDPNRWLLIQAGQYVGPCENFQQVPPQQLIAFTADPGDGCEQANFGLGIYPRSIFTAQGRLHTGFKGWLWYSFCKSQYASNPDCGGIENFIRCHLSVIRLLDHAKSMGMLGHVNDESDYWERRDLAALVDEVGQWNEMAAGLAGKLKDLIGNDVDGAILDYPNFEHLEAVQHLREKH